VLWLAAVGNPTINMGARPSSKVSCRFSEEWQDAWRARLDEHVAKVWLPIQTAGFRAVYTERAALLRHA
jgi:hypothetical protein